MKNSNKLLLGLIGAIALFGIFSIVAFRSGVGNLIASEKVVGNEDFKTETRTVDAFENLDVSHFFDVILEQGERKIVIEAESNILESIITEVENNTLRIKKKRGIRIKPNETPKIYVTVPTLESIHISGAGNFKTKGVFSANDMQVSISGASDMNLNLECEKLKAEMSGAAELEIKGSAKYFEASTSGAGEIDAEDFVTESSSVEISGAASIKVHATEHLDAQISGVGSIHYAGNPKTVDKQVSGMGSIDPM